MRSHRAALTSTVPAADHPRALTPARAIAWAVVAGCVFAFVFGIRAGIVAVPVLAVILWRGSARGR